MVVQKIPLDKELVDNPDKNVLDDREEAMKLIKKHTYVLPRTKLGWTLTIIVLISFLMVYPGLIWANSAYPFILGMPFTFVWLTFWVHVILVVGIYAGFKLWI